MNDEQAAYWRELDRERPGRVAAPGRVISNLAARGVG